jgi:hypothetical protein
MQLKANFDHNFSKPQLPEFRISLKLPRIATAVTLKFAPLFCHILGNRWTFSFRRRKTPFHPIVYLRDTAASMKYLQRRKPWPQQVFAS